MDTEITDFEERERIRYKHNLGRIQKFKNLILVSILGMMAYAANAINFTNNAISLILLLISCITLLFSLIIAGIDAGGSIFYNEKSQEGVPKKNRVIMYICVLLSAVFIFSAQIFNAVENFDNVEIKAKQLQRK